MKLYIYSAYDKQGMCFGPLFQVRARGEAVRSFMDAVKDPKTPMGKYPADFVLYYIGEWDDMSGKVISVEHGPVSLISGLDVVSYDIEGATLPFDMNGASATAPGG